MRVVGRVLFGALPAICLAAITWYAWPRSSDHPDPGTIITQYYPGLLWLPVSLLAAHWLAYLGMAFNWERRLSGARRAALRLLLATPAGVAISMLGALVIIVLGSMVMPTSLYVAAGLVLAVCAKAAFLLLRRAPRRMWFYAAAVGPLAAMASPILLPLWYFGSHPWTDWAELRVPDGRVFHAQHFGGSDLLTQEISHSALFLRRRVIAANYQEYSGIALVRPAQRGYKFRAGRGRGWKSDGRLVLSTDGRSIAFIYPYHSYRGNKPGCATNLIYDFATGERWCISGPDDAEQLDRQSPFFLIGPSDRINVGDVQAITMGGDGTFVSVCEDPDTIAALRHHRNPWVRVAVSVWQKTLSKDAAGLDRDLTREAAANPDPGQRAAAREALTWLRQLVGGAKPRS